MSEVTRILSRIDQGDPAAADQLLPLVYEELRKLAAAKLSREQPGQTLQPTALVHEAYLRLVDCDEQQNWNGRGHFFSAAAEAIRRILIERARSKKRLKRGGSARKVQLDEGIDLAADQELEELIDLHEVLDLLEERDPEKAAVVKMRFFAGLTIPQIAEAMSISSSTADRYWAYARAWLVREMAK